MCERHAMNINEKKMKKNQLSFIQLIQFMLKTFSSIFNHRRCHFKNHPPHSPNTNDFLFKCKVLLILSYFYQGL